MDDNIVKALKESANAFNKIQLNDLMSGIATEEELKENPYIENVMNSI